jgi:hypothetical protein
MARPPSGSTAFARHVHTTEGWKFVVLGSTTRRLHANSLQSPNCRASRSWRRNSRPRGIDSLICVPVNDSYVMAAWAEDQRATGIVFLPDTIGDFGKCRW